MERSDAKQNTDRRNFFRIDDVSILYHRVLADDEVSYKGSDAVRFDQLAINKLTLKARFDSLSRELIPLNNVIEQSSPKLARYLAVIDKKLNMLSEVLMGAAIDELDEKPQKVNISAGGLSFVSPDPIAPDSILELRVVLLPSNVGIYSHAKVISCDKDSSEGEDRYKVAVEFVRMDEESRDQISRHVLGREQAALISKAQDR